MKKYSHIIIITVFVFAVWSCDAHDPIDTNIYPGFVLTSDNNTMSIGQFTATDDIEAIGVVFASANDDHPTLAVTLDEILPVAFSEPLGYDQGTSATTDLYDGFLNTTKMQNLVADSLYTSPLAYSVFRRAHFGQSLFIPSVAELRLLFAALPQVNPVIVKLGGTPISTNSIDGSCWYWSSSEVKENKSMQAWLVSSTNGSYQETPKDGLHPARAILSINY